MTTSVIFGLPFVDSITAQPEVIINEMIVLMEAMNCGVLTIGDNAPPGSPAEGDAYIIGASPTGAWAGRANCVGYYSVNGWRFLPALDNTGTPIVMGAAQEGFTKVNKSDGLLYGWTGAAWTAL